MLCVTEQKIQAIKSSIYSLQRRHNKHMDQRFLFVNHDAKTLGNRNDVQLINTHVQKYGQKRRRKLIRELSNHSLPLDNLRIAQGQNEAYSDSSPESDQPSESGLDKESSMLEIRSMGRHVDLFSSLVSNDCVWLVETLDYCKRSQVADTCRWG
jgi:hypothetical protein